MAYVRLTNDDRKAITRAAMQHAFSDKVGELLGRLPDLCERLYDSLMTDEQREHVDALPDNFFSQLEFVDIYLDSSWERVYNNPYSRSHSVFDYCTKHDEAYHAAKKAFKGKKMKMPTVFNSRAAVEISSSKAKGIHKEVAQWFKDKENLEEKINLTKSNSLQLLAGLRSYKQLKESWPEVVPFCGFLDEREKGNAGTPTANLPAIPMKTLNDNLELPV